MRSKLGILGSGIDILDSSIELSFIIIDEIWGKMLLGISKFLIRYEGISVALGLLIYAKGFTSSDLFNFLSAELEISKFLISLSLSSSSMTTSTLGFTGKITGATSVCGGGWMLTWLSILIALTCTGSRFMISATGMPRGRLACFLAS